MKQNRLLLSALVALVLTAALPVMANAQILGTKKCDCDPLNSSDTYTSVNVEGKSICIKTSCDGAVR